MSGAEYRGLGRNAAYAILALGVERAVALGIALYLPRHLELADYGRYAFLVSYLALFQGLLDASLEAVLIAHFAGTGDDAAAAAGRAAWLRLGTSIAGGTIALGLLPFIGGDERLFRAGALAAVGFAGAAANPYRVLLRVRLAMGRYLLLIVAQAAVALGALGLVVHAGGGLVAVLAAVAVGSLSGVPFGRLLAGAGVAFRSPDRTLVRALVAAAWPLAGSALVMAGGQQVLQLLLLRLHGAAVLGLYGGAQKLIEAVGLLPQALMVSVLPALAAAGRTSGEEAALAARDAARLLIVVLVPVGAAFGLWAGPVLGAVLGPRFTAAAAVLHVLAAVVLLGATGAVLTNLLVATGRQRPLFAITSATALTMAALGAVLVPRHDGVGAAIALVGTMLGGQVALLVLPVTRALARPVLVGLLRPIGVGAAMTVLVLAMGATPAAGLALLAIGYPAALVATGTLTRADLARWSAVPPP